MIGIEREARIKATGEFVCVRKDQDRLDEGLPEFCTSDGECFRRDELEFYLDE